MADLDERAGAVSSAGEISTRPSRIIAPLAFAVCRRALKRIERGRVRITLPDGSSQVFIAPRAGANAHLQINNAGIVWKAMRRGTIGMAESYLNGDWQTPDLAEVFRFFVENKSALVRAGQGLFQVRRRDQRYHGERANTRSGSRRNIAEHYDLGNEFYALWLDPTMTYSSAIFTSAEQSLEEAQHAKYARIADRLRLVPGDHVLEIGCGWGGFASYAASQRGLNVDGITLSRKQLMYAQARLAADGLSHRARARICDYRDTEGQYDGIASIEMIEAVGREHWPDYFSTLRDRLRSGGRAAIQAITIDESLAASYRRAPDFIQRYIFPGGVLPTITEIEDQVRQAGLSLESQEHFADSYARTLWLWRERFEDRWKDIARLGFDERFRRLWNYYLTYCAVGFEQRTINVGIYTLTRKMPRQNKQIETVW